MTSKEKGDWAEDLAQSFYKSRGYRIVARNYRYRHGEIDLITRKCEQLKFVEVKARTNFNYGQPSQYVNYYKRQHLIRTAKAYIFKNWQELNEFSYSFDIVEVNLIEGKLRLIENAFSVK